MELFSVGVLIAPFFQFHGAELTKIFESNCEVRHLTPKKDFCVNKDNLDLESELFVHCDH